jgi:MFS-type transporter involved in bile tolerance (Atg22 family)
VPVRRSIAEGFRAVFGTPALRAMATQSTVLNMCFHAVITLFVVYAVRSLHLSPLKLGIVIGASAAGGLAGALSATQVRNAIGLGRTLAVTTVGVSAAPLLLLVPRDGSPPAVAVLVAAQLGYGACMAMFNVNAITLRQVITPRQVLARMNATYRMLIYGAPPVGGVAAGLLGTAVGLRSALVISLIALTTPIAWIFFSPVFRLREMPHGLETKGC